MPGAQFLLSCAVTPQRASGQKILILLYPPPYTCEVFSYTATSVSRCRWLCRKAYTRYARFRPSGALPKPRAARFRASGVLPLLPRRVSDLRECSQGFPGVFSAFGGAPVASPVHFHASGAFLRLHRHRFVFRECARMFTSALSARGAEIIQNHFIRRMNHGTDNSGKGERQGARDGA